MKNNDNFVVNKNIEESTVTMTLRIGKNLLAQYDDLAKKSNRSRNELLNQALRYAYDHLEFMDD